MLSLLDANGALLVAAVGILLVCAEFCLPGWVLPGVLGGVGLVCGVYRLTDFAPSWETALALVLAVAAASAAGYGLAPAWLGVVALASVPALCRRLVPGGISWPVAVFAAVVPATVFILLRVASRAAANKTLVG